MKIKLTYSLREMYVARERDLPVSLQGAEGEQYVLWLREIEHQGNTVKQLCCDVIIDVAPPKRANDTLLALKDNILLLDDPIQPGLPQTSIGSGTIVDRDGNIKPNWIVDFDLLPSNAKPWFKKIKSDLSKKLTNFVKQIRWIQNSSGGHRPFSVVGAFWSSDGEEWSRFPTEMSASFFAQKPIATSAEKLEVLRNIMRNETFEPISHDLLREAKELTRQAPRSALLVAFSALETGIKLQLHRMIPNASALIEKMPSPPLVTGESLLGMTALVSGLRLLV